MKIGIIGGGNMGTAIAAGLIASNTLPPADITVTSPRQATLTALTAQLPGIVTDTDNSAAVRDADVIILAVKPWLIEQVLEEIAPRVDFRSQIVVSLAASVTLADLDHILRNYTTTRSIIRAIPNTALSVGRSMTFLCHGDTLADPTHIDTIQALFAPLGHVAIIPESRLDAAMALCSCGIAYVMRFIRAASLGACELGLRTDEATQWFIETIQGATALLQAQGANPEAEIDKVTTPGGLTIRGLNALEQSGFSSAVVNALRASVKK